MKVGDVLVAREVFSDRSTVVEGSTDGRLRRSPPTAAKLVLPVWGYRYVRQFLEVSLPTLLAPGNIPALAEALDCEFIILTSVDDQSQIVEHPAFVRLSKVCRTSIRLIDHLITDGNHSTTITIAYTEAIRSVGAAMVDTCFFFLVSDYIVADGSLANALARMRRGASAVIVGNFQVDGDEAEPGLREALRAAGAALALTPRQLIRWALDHLHPATIANTVNIPLTHNSHTNRLFWRVDGATVLGRFYLMHMLCVRPELVEFTIGASCDYSFIPEMCPSGDVEAITDSDECLIVEMQPRGHESAFLRPGPHDIKALAKSLAEWTTATHRDNARRSIVFHADDIPSAIADNTVKADAFIEEIARAITVAPQPHRDHPYWRGAMAAFLDATGRRLTIEESRYALTASVDGGWFNEWVMWRAKNAVLGRPPRVFPWHPAWVDFRAVLQELEPFFEDRNKRLLMLSNAPTPFTVALSDSGERVRRLRCSPFLKSPPERYQPLAGYFDICLIELAEDEMRQGAHIVDRVVPLMKPDGVIIVSIYNRRKRGDPRVMPESFGPHVSYGSVNFIRPGALPTEVQYVPANLVRWTAYQSLGGLRDFASRTPVIGFPVLAVCAGFLMLMSALGNLDRLRRTSGTTPRGICSSMLLRLRVDGRGAKPGDAQAYKLAGSAGADEGKADSEDGDATREVQYSRCVELRKKFGLTSLGLMTNQVWYDDPRRLTFLLARYKFVAKMLSGRANVGEVGCGDAFGTRIVQQEVGRVTAYDFDPVFIQDVRSRQTDRWPLRAELHDILAGPLPERHDGVYSLDVLEHIAPEHERTYVENLCRSLTNDGVLIIGTPSIESQNYASPLSKAGHVNCKSGTELKVLLDQYFDRVFIFSMNDEVVHTGFYPMAHYLFAICAGARFTNKQLEERTRG